MQERKGWLVKLMAGDKARTNCANRKFKRNYLIALLSFGFFYRSTCSSALTWKTKKPLATPWTHPATADGRQLDADTTTDWSSNKLVKIWQREQEATMDFSEPVLNSQSNTLKLHLRSRGGCDWTPQSITGRFGSLHTFRTPHQWLIGKKWEIQTLGNNWRLFAASKTLLEYYQEHL